MATLTFPLWLMFIVLSPVLIIFFVLGFTAAKNPAISEKPPVIERRLS
jgi:hypothetical protein